MMLFSFIGFGLDFCSLCIRCNMFSWLVVSIGILMVFGISR